MDIGIQTYKVTRSIPLDLAISYKFI